jgi:hypothetical protein
VRCPSGGFSLLGALGFFFGKEGHLRASKAVLLDACSAFSHRRPELKRANEGTVERLRVRCNGVRYGSASAARSVRQ